MFINAAESITRTSGPFFFASPLGDTVSLVEYERLSPEARADLFPAAAMGPVIDGSIRNTLQTVFGESLSVITDERLTGSFAAEAALARVAVGDIRTTALGAVNAGQLAFAADPDNGMSATIAGGVVSQIQDVAVDLSRALSASSDQIGASAARAGLSANIASNNTRILGEVSNIVTMVNYDVQSISTTALGAVNTGAIMSGVSATVNGITGASGGQR